MTLYQENKIKLKNKRKLKKIQMLFNPMIKLKMLF